jgi:adenylate cyclase
VAEERVQRRLAAILAADVVGYSRMMGEDEAGTLARLNALRKEVFEPKVKEYGGRIFKTTGDGVLIEFPSAVDAVQHAIDVQQTVKQRSQSIPEDRRIELRIGINLGDVIIEGDDVFGDGVNIAARLEGICEPGGIYLSDIVHASIRNKLDIAFADLGEQSVKNIVDPVHVFRVALASTDTENQETIAPDASFRRPAVAVLPFENMSGDPEQEYFADGLTEDITTALSLWRTFPVISRNSTFAYKGQSPNIRDVGKELEARYIVEGSVRKSGERIRVTAQLINAETGHHVWAERYDRNMEDIFDLQDEITHHIAATIEPAIEQTEHERIVAKRPSDLAAWEFWLRGYAFIYDGTQEGNEKARGLFQRAIELDPNYARAYTGLAYTYGRDLRYFGATDKKERLKLLSDNARRAVALDETDAEARTMLVRTCIQTGQPEAAVSEAREAVRLNPYNAGANNVLGVALAWSAAKFEEGIPWIERAIELNPLDPLRYVTMTHLALAHFGAKHFEEAVECAEKALRHRPENLEARTILAAALGYLGRGDHAKTVLTGFEGAAVNTIQNHIMLPKETKHFVLDGLRKAGWEG